MKRTVYFVVCVLSIGVVGFMCYYSWIRFQETGMNFDNVGWCLITLGWMNTTYNILTKSYNWTRKLLK